MEKIDSICVRSIGRNPDNPSLRISGIYVEQKLEINNDGTRTNTLTGTQKDNWILEIWKIE